MFVPPLATKFELTHLLAFSIFSTVAGSKVEENMQVSSLNAITLNKSLGPSLASPENRALFVSSRGWPLMLPLMSTINTTSFLKTYKTQMEVV